MINTVNTIIVSYIRKSTSNIEPTKWDQISNINVWNLIVAIAEKRRILIKLFSLIILILINWIITEDMIVVVVVLYYNRFYF